MSLENLIGMIHCSGPLLIDGQQNGLSTGLISLLLRPIFRLKYEMFLSKIQYSASNHIKEDSKLKNFLSSPD